MVQAALHRQLVQHTCKKVICWLNWHILSCKSAQRISDHTGNHRSRKIWLLFSFVYTFKKIKHTEKICFFIFLMFLSFPERSKGVNSLEYLFFAWKFSAKFPLLFVCSFEWTHIIQFKRHKLLVSVGVESRQGRIGLVGLLFTVLYASKSEHVVWNGMLSLVRAPWSSNIITKQRRYYINSQFRHYMIYSGNCSLFTVHCASYWTLTEKPRDSRYYTAIFLLGLHFCSFECKILSCLLLYNHSMLMLHIISTHIKTWLVPASLILSTFISYPTSYTVKFPLGAM